MATLAGEGTALCDGPDVIQRLLEERTLTFLDESSAGVEQGRRFLLAATEVYLIDSAAR